MGTAVHFPERLPLLLYAHLGLGDWKLSQSLFCDYEYDTDAVDRTSLVCYLEFSFINIVFGSHLCLSQQV